MANINRYDDLYTGTIAYATFLSCIVLVVTILGVRALCYAFVEGEEQRKTEGIHYVAADDVISEQKARLDGYRQETVEVMVTKEDGTLVPSSEQRLRIPIGRAKELILGSQSPST
ncbi:MAG: hypothetical protein VXZ82_03210 [Planctomycetota bacterium]|nr:hypothetical protein [Planctomycetota bacterium]